MRGPSESLYDFNGVERKSDEKDPRDGSLDPKYSLVWSAVKSGPVWAKLREVIPSESSQIVCLGLGSPIQSKAALYQLVLVGLMAEQCGCKVRLWDPIFDEEDVAYLEKLGHLVGQKGKDEQSCLYYLPHFPILELDKFIAESEPRFLLSNDLGGYAGKLTDRAFFERYPTCATLARMLEGNIDDAPVAKPSDEFTVVKRKRRGRKGAKAAKAEAAASDIPYDFEGMYFRNPKSSVLVVSSSVHSETHNAFTDLAMMELK